MSQQAFQQTLTRLVIDPEFRDAFRAAAGKHNVTAGEGELTILERKRLESILDDRGLDATRTLHKSFRLTKLYAALPLTRRLIPTARLAELVGAFWKAHPPVSHYFIDEAIAFCDFVQGRVGAGLRIKYLTEIVAYERANLILRRPQNAKVREPVQVEFQHDPMILFEQLTSGKTPRAVAGCKCTLQGSIDEAGEVKWELLS